MTATKALLLDLAATVTTDDPELRNAVHAASSLAHGYTHRWFVPFVQTRTYDAIGDHIGAYYLDLDTDLLELTTLTNGDSAAIASSIYLLRPSNVTPKNRIELRLSGFTSFRYNTDWQAAISVDGIWGYHDDYTNAWGSTGQTLASGINSSATTFDVTSAAASVDDQYRTAFEVLGYLKIENEMLQITNISTDTLTVLRGVNGTTAASHSSGVAIKNYRQIPEIESAVGSLAAWLYRNRQTIGERVTFLSGAEIVTNIAPQNIRDTLVRYERQRILAAG